VSGLRADSLGRICGLSHTPGLDIQAPPTLTSREEEVARLAAIGMSNQAIADKLVVSVRTVEAHLAHVYAKLGITGRATLASTLSSVTGARRGGEQLSVAAPAGPTPRRGRGSWPV
jgi:DNA-binding NarL/FixJ family response regulator